MENIVAQQLVKMQGEILGKIRENGLQDIGWLRCPLTLN